MPCALASSPPLQRVAIHSCGAIAAAVDGHGGVYVFDLLRHTRVRVWQEGPFSGALCFARANEVLLSVSNKVRVIDVTSHKHLISLLGHKADVSFAASNEQNALTFSSDRLMLWQISDWSLLRQTQSCPEAQLIAAALATSQVGALYRGHAGPQRGRLSWSLWCGSSPLAEGVVPRLDGVAVMCLSQLAIGDGFVGMVAKKKKSKTHEVLVWKVPSVPYGASDALTAPWRLQTPRLQQILAARRQLLLATREEVLLLEVPSGQLRHVPWPGLATLDVAVSGVAVGLAGTAMTFSVKQLQPRKSSRSHSRRSGQGPKQPLRTLPRSKSAEAVPPTEPASFPASSAALAEFLRRFGGFGRGQRPRCWQQLLGLPGDRTAGSDGDRLDNQELPAERLRPRERLAQRLISWRPDLEKEAGLEAVSQLASGVFEDHEVLGFELGAKLWSNWLEPLARAATRRRKLLSWAEQQLRQRDLELSIYLEVVVKHQTPADGATLGSRILWPMLRSFLLRCLPRSVCMVLWDHLILSWREPWHLLLAALSILRCKRQLLLHLSPSQSGDKAVKLIMSATETDPAELLKNFHALRNDIRDLRDIREVKELWNQDVEDMEVAESEVIEQECVLEGKDKETQTEEICLEAEDFARLFSDLTVPPQHAPAMRKDATAETLEADLVTEAEKNEFLRFRAAIHASGDASDQSTVLPSAGPTVLETEIKAGLARLDTSLDSTTMDFPDFSDSGMEVCT